MVLEALAKYARVSLENKGVWWANYDTDNYGGSFSDKSCPRTISLTAYEWASQTPPQTPATAAEPQPGR